MYTPERPRNVNYPRNSSYQPDVSNEVAHTVGDER